MVHQQNSNKIIKYPSDVIEFAAMAVPEETTPLVSNKTKERSKTHFAQQLQFFLSLGTCLIVFKASEDMASTTFKQFLYQWCKDNIPPNSSVSASKTEHDCPSKNTSTVSDDAAQKLASDWELYFTLVNSLLAFFSASILGTISDYTGRKPLLCLAMSGYAFRIAVTSFVIYFQLHVGYIMIGYIIDGMLGTYYAVSLFSYSSTADKTGTKMKQRVLGVAIIETILGVGKVSTQFGNGYFIHDTGFFYPMLTATAGLVLSVILTTILFEEPKKQRNSVNEGRTNLCCQRLPSFKTLFRNYVGFYVQKRNKSDKHIFWLCLLIFILHEIVLQGRSNPIVLFQLATPFCWSSELIGWYNATYIAAVYIVGCVVLKPLQSCFSPGTIGCIGFVSSIGFYVVTGLATSSVGMFSAIGAGVIMLLPKSVLRGMASSKASGELQGAMFAGLQSSELACLLISSPLSLTIYSGTLDIMKGLVFLVLAGIDVVALLLMICLTRMLAKNESRTVEVVTVNETKIGET